MHRAFLAARREPRLERLEQALRQMVGRMEAMPALAEGAALPDPSRFAAALGASLDSHELEPAFVALMLSPPGEGDIAGEIGREVDTDLVHRAREWLRGESGRMLENQLYEAWKRAEPDPTYSPDPLNAGKRALRHAVLGLLAAADPDEGATLALEQFASARNMVAPVPFGIITSDYFRGRCPKCSKSHRSGAESIESACGFAQAACQIIALSNQ